MLMGRITEKHRGAIIDPDQLQQYVTRVLTPPQ